MATIESLNTCISLFVFFVISRFIFEGGIWGLIAPVPDHCILLTFKVFQNILFH